MSRRVVLATRNAGKVAELRRILAAYGDVEVVDAESAGLGDVDETGATFAENALLKARAGATSSGLPTLADDSGLEVAALHGEPGVRSARYAGRHGDDDANLRLVLARLDGVDDRRGRFVCAAALVVPDGREWVEEGVWDGELVTQPRGTGGFGYDPIFRPVGESRTSAELSPDEKDMASHRGRAFRRLAPRVAQL